MPRSPEDLSVLITLLPDLSDQRVALVAVEVDEEVDVVAAEVDLVTVEVCIGMQQLTETSNKANTKSSGRGGGRGRGGFGDRGRGAPRGGRGGSTNRGGFGDFKGKKQTF